MAKQKPALLWQTILDEQRRDDEQKHEYARRRDDQLKQYEALRAALHNAAHFQVPVERNSKFAAGWADAIIEAARLIVEHGYAPLLKDSPNEWVGLRLAKEAYRSALAGERGALVAITKAATAAALRGGTGGNLLRGGLGTVAEIITIEARQKQMVELHQQFPKYAPNPVQTPQPVPNDEPSVSMAGDSSPPVIYYHASRNYSVDGINPIRVSNEENCILGAFLETGLAMDTEMIETKSGVTNVSRIIDGLRKRYSCIFADAIRTPGGVKGNGGYFIRVVKHNS